MRRVWKPIVGVVVIGLIAGILYVKSLIAINVPDYPQPTRTTWLEQNWTDPERLKFHHAPQGTRTFVIPFEWFMAIERGEFHFGDAGAFADQHYLDRSKIS